jgi:hypothetical protein
MAAAAKLREAGKKPIVEIMIPLTVTREELALARSWVQDEVDAAVKGMKRKPHITIGTMIETPRAAIRADELAEVSDFFSFGTNDLTQLTFGFSRDDIESRMMPAYLEQGLLKRNPFDTIDQSGVGDLVRMGVQRGRATKPGLKMGVCGEHGGDPESIEMFYRAGLDYVSCSPFRVPIARLAAAQAIVGAGDSTTYPTPSNPPGHRRRPPSGDAIASDRAGSELAAGPIAVFGPSWDAVSCNPVCCDPVSPTWRVRSRTAGRARAAPVRGGRPATSGCLR